MFSHHFLSLNQLLIALLVVVVFSPTICCAQGFLDGVRKEVTRDRSSQSSNDNHDDDDDQDCYDHHHQSNSYFHAHHHSYYDDNCDDDTSILGYIIGGVIEGCVGSIFTGSRSSENESVDELVEYYGFEPYPYFDSEFGRLCADIDRDRYDISAHRLAAEWLISDQQVDTVRGRWIYETIRGGGIDSEIAYLRQRPGGNDLLLGDANLTYRFSTSAQSQWRVGLGVNWMADNNLSEAGFNFTYGGDIFFARPFVWSTDIDWGTLGNTNLFHARTTLGMIHKQSELYAGYDYLSIGAPKQHSFVTGLRFWF